MYSFKSRTAGNLVNEKHEVKKRMRRFIKVVTQTGPNKETIAWRKAQPKKPIVRSGKRLMELKAIEASNERLRQNLLSIMGEDRTKTSNVIRGVQSAATAKREKESLENFRNLHSREKQNEKESKKIEVMNQIIKDQLENVQPTIIQDIEDEDFKVKLRSRRVSQTCLHLGLIKEAVKFELSERPVSANSIMESVPEPLGRQRSFSLFAKSKSMSNLQSGSEQLTRTRSVSISQDHNHTFGNIPDFTTSTNTDDVAEEIKYNTCSSKSMPNVSSKSLIPFDSIQQESQTPTTFNRQIPKISDIYTKLKTSITEKRNSFIMDRRSSFNGFSMGSSISNKSRRNSIKKIVPVDIDEDDSCSNSAITEESYTNQSNHSNQSHQSHHSLQSELLN